jgi:adenylosuccinate synthase
LIPCGILRLEKHAVIGSGTVVDPAALMSEVETLTSAGIDVTGRLHVSNRAHVIFPFHRQIDKAAEAARGSDNLGTTKRGIGPAYEDKVARRGLRICDLMDAEVFRAKLARLLDEKAATFRKTYGVELEITGLVEESLVLAERLRPYVIDTAMYLNQALDKGRSVMFEGAQGTMLDIDHGTYPFVTSSSSTAGGASAGCGVPPIRITGVIGVTKAYTTRVGTGPFPTEMPDIEAEEVRSRGNEFGSVTGRPRRCGWLDLVMLRYAVMINGIGSMVVTKLDVFDTQKEIQVCVGYKYKGTPVKEMPAEVGKFAALVPEYKSVRGWQSPTFGLREESKLPQLARDYLKFISDEIGTEVGLVSTGPERDATMVCGGSQLEKWLRD